MEVMALDVTDLLRCDCGCQIFEVKWHTRVRPGRHRAHLVNPKKMFTCTACGLKVAARAAINRKDS